MPQTTPERVDRWPGMDDEAMAFLRSAGWVLTRSWEWYHPDADHKASERETDAIIYLIEEWDFGGVTDQASPK